MAEVKLFKAVNAGDFAAVHRLLEEGCTPDVVDKDSWTAAGRAASRGKSGVIQIMLEHGLDPNLTGVAGITLLHVSAGANRYLVSKMLLQAGADATAKNEKGLTPLDVASDVVVKKLIEDSVSNGPPEPNDDGVYEEDEQVYCLDKHKMWWPAIVKEVDDAWYSVHFPGFGKRDDIRVQADSLVKVTRDNVDRIEEERQAIIKAANAAKKTPKRKSDEDKDGKDGKEGKDTKDAKEKKPKKEKRRSKPAADSPAAKKRKPQADEDLPRSELLDTFDDVIFQLQEQRRTVASLGKEHAAISSKNLAEKETVIKSLEEQINKANLLIAEQSKMLSRKDRDTKRLHDEIAKLRQELQEATMLDKMTPTVGSYSGKKGEIVEKMRQIAKLNARLQQLEAENDRYKYLLKKYQSEEQGSSARSQIDGLSEHAADHAADQSDATGDTPQVEEPDKQKQEEEEENEGTEVQNEEEQNLKPEESDISIPANNRKESATEDTVREQVSMDTAEEIATTQAKAPSVAEETTGTPEETEAASPSE